MFSTALPLLFVESFTTFQTFCFKNCLPLNCRHNNTEAKSEQENRIRQRPQDFGPRPSVCVVAAVFSRIKNGQKTDDEAEYIGQHVKAVCHQGRRVRDISVNLNSLKTIF